MISSLRGNLISIKGTEILLDVNGVGYHIFVTKRLAENVENINAEYTIITHLDVKESSLILYGFADERERELFKLLISVSGVGPKLAHNVLTHSTFEDVMGLITGANRGMKIPGLGTKKIELIAMTLKDKIFKIITDGEQSSEGQQGFISKDRNVAEAANALMNLGYTKNEAEKIINEVTRTGDVTELSTEEIIRRSLQYTS
jgi:Holliday junction DNA helicase RuvA